MEHKNTIKRDRLYVGELVIPYEYRLKNDGKILVYTYELCRNILFSLDGDMATDVLFEVPQYPIVNITDQSKCEIGKMAIKDAICLDELLKYFQVSSNENVYLEYLFDAKTYTEFIYRYSIVKQLTEYNDELSKELKQRITDLENSKIELKENIINIIFINIATKH